MTRLYRGPFPVLMQSSEESAGETEGWTDGGTDGGREGGRECREMCGGTRVSGKVGVGTL